MSSEQSNAEALHAPRHWLVFPNDGGEWVTYDATEAEWLRDGNPNCEVQGPFVLLLEAAPTPPEDECG